MKTTRLSLAIKPCYLQLAATGDEIQAAGRTCGDKISSRSAVGHQAAAYTRNVLCCTQSLRACLLFLIRSCHRDVHSSGLCHPVILALTHHSSNCHPLMTFNETTWVLRKLAQLHCRQKRICWLIDWIMKSIDSKTQKLQSFIASNLYLLLIDCL